MIAEHIVWVEVMNWSLLASQIWMERVMEISEMSLAAQNWAFSFEAVWVHDILLGIAYNLEKEMRVFYPETKCHILNPHVLCLVQCCWGVETVRIEPAPF